MKRTLGVIIVLGGLVFILAMLDGMIGGQKVTYQAPLATSTSAVEEAPKPAEMLEKATKQLIAEAITASSTEIEKAKTEAANKVEKEMTLKIERQVRLTLEHKNDVELKAIEGQMSFQ